MAGSFTQLIWKDSTKFGIAKSFAHKKGLPQVFVAAIYRAPGNLKGFYHENILKGRFKKSYCEKVHTRHVIEKNANVITTSALKSILEKRWNDLSRSEEKGMEK